MTEHSTKATVHFAGDDLFIGISPSGHAIALDTNHERSSAPSPVELLLLALGSCTGIDVVSILTKKRLKISAYRIEISGERREEHPRSYRTMTVHHIITGSGIPHKAVEQAIELSETKYCSVAATLRPTVEIHSSFKIIEEAEKDAEE